MNTQQIDLTQYKYNDGSSLADTIHPEDHSEVIGVWESTEEYSTYVVEFKDRGIHEY